MFPEFFFHGLLRYRFGSLPTNSRAVVHLPPVQGRGTSCRGVFDAGGVGVVCGAPLTALCPCRTAVCRGARPHRSRHRGPGTECVRRHRDVRGPATATAQLHPEGPLLKSTTCGCRGRGEAAARLNEGRIPPFCCCDAAPVLAQLTVQEDTGGWHAFLQQQQQQQVLVGQLCLAKGEQRNKHTPTTTVGVYKQCEEGSETHG